MFIRSIDSGNGLLLELRGSYRRTEQVHDVAAVQSKEVSSFAEVLTSV